MSTELYVFLYICFSHSTNINYFISLSLPLQFYFANYKNMTGTFALFILNGWLEVP